MTEEEQIAYAMKMSMGGEGDEGNQGENRFAFKITLIDFI